MERCSLCHLEHTLVLVLEHKVQSLGGEVSDHVGEISSPERGNTLLLGYSHKDINDTFVLTLSLGGSTLSLILEEKLDTLDGCSKSLGDTRGNSSDEEGLDGVESLIELTFTGSKNLYIRMCVCVCVLKDGVYGIEPSDSHS